MMISKHTLGSSSSSGRRRESRLTNKPQLRCDFLSTFYRLSNDFRLILVRVEQQRKSDAMKAKENAARAGDFTLKMMISVLNMMIYVLKVMTFVLKMMIFVLKMMNLQRERRQRRSGRRLSWSALGVREKSTIFSPKLANNDRFDTASDGFILTPGGFHR